MTETKGERNEHAELGSSLLETLKQSEIPRIGIDLAEIALDSRLTEGVTRDIPVLGTLAGLWAAGRTVRDYLFTRKLIAFLSSLADVPRTRRVEMITRLEDDLHFGRRVGEAIVLLLDRLDAMSKAELVGRAFRAYCLGDIDATTLERVNHAIDRILERDLRRLPEFVANSRLVDDATKQAFVNAGLAFVPEGMASTAVEANRGLCKVILKHVLVT